MDKYRQARMYVTMLDTKVHNHVVRDFAQGRLGVMHYASTDVPHTPTTLTTQGCRSICVISF